MADPCLQESGYAVIERWTIAPTEPCTTEVFATREDAERACAEYRRAQAGGLSYTVEER